MLTNGGKAMRPKAIAYFEWIMYGTLALGIVQNFLVWNDLIEAVRSTQPNPVAFIVLTQAFTIALAVALTLLISRRRSRVAMWISIGLFVIGSPIVFALAREGLLVGAHLSTILRALAQLFAYGLLFTPEARAWMKPARVASDR
jgi:hypothetical protein